ncbi:MAG: ThuA domain-containing protein [Limisphaerales bacterium]
MNRANLPAARRSFFLLMIVSTCLWSVVPASVQAKPDEIRVLIVTGMDIPAHEWRKTTPAIKEELEKDPRMKVEVLDDPYRLETTDLSKHDVVFLHFNNGEKPDPSEKSKADLKKFVEQGGGLFVLHFACGAFSNWTEYPALIGRIWDRKNTHDPRGPFQVKIVNADHPITQNMTVFDTDDELYTCLTGAKPVELLATARSKVTQTDQPMAFVHTYGKGRVFHTPLGHDVRAIRMPGTAELIRRGCAWVAGRDPLPAEKAASRFTLPEGFEISLVAAEPDIVNPMTMCVDEHGVIYVTESHTYRWGANGSPFNPPTNPIKRIELGPNGRAARTVVVAEGFPEPVIGICARAGKIYATCLNELFAMDIARDGQGVNRKLLVKDAAVEWNPFGMYRVQVGPDDKLWLCIADHPRGQPVELTGSDGRKVRLNGKSGGLVRCHLDGSDLEILVQGFRAPYAFDIDPWGHLWHISNGEGSPNLYVHVIPGLDYGYASRKVSYAWLAGTEPLSPPVRDMGAGANTSALHSSMLPREFWGDIFVSNWGSHGPGSRNRMVGRFRRAKDGVARIGTADTELVEAAPFVTTTDPMFRPTGMVLAPDGGFYLIDWHGQDDESDRTGRLFKIAYTGNDQPTAVRPPAPDAIDRMKPGALATLLGHPNHLVRELAERALVEAGTTALEPLGRIVEQGDAFAAAHAVWTLTRMNGEAATQTLTRAVKHADPRVRAHAVRQLRQAAGFSLGVAADAGASLAAARTLDRGALIKLATPLRHDPDAEVRVEAALCLGSSAAVGEALLGALEVATDRRLRYQIGLELARHGDAASLKQLWRRDDVEAKRVALIAMENARYENTPLAGLAKELAAQDFLSRFNLLVKLGGAIQANDEDAATFLERLDSGELRLAGAAEKIQTLHLTEALAPKKLPVQFLLACLQGGDASVQGEALQVVRQRASEEPALRDAIRSIARSAASPSLQAQAVYTLGLTDSSLSANEWLAWIGHPSKPVATAALRALRQSERKPEIVRAVLEAAPEVAKRDADLAEEVVLTLRMLGVTTAQLDGLPLKLPPQKDKSSLAGAVLARLPNASPTLGRLTFFSNKTGCAKCHSVRPDIVKFGPLLSEIGTATQPQYLVESILEPSKIIKTGFLNERVETKEGKEFTGLVQADGDRLAVILSADQKVSLHPSQVKWRTPSNVSLMPEGLEAAMTESELADLVAYLASLKAKK